MKNIFKKISPIALAILMLTSCEKEYLETIPSDKASAETVYATTAGARVALDGIVRTMWSTVTTGHHSFGQKAIELSMDLMGNDMTVHSRGYNWFNAEYQYTAITNPANNTRSDIDWTFYYRLINNANRLIANIDNATGETAEKEYLKGNALAIRAYSYFYLVNLWQHTYKGHENDPAVPLYTEPTIVGKPRATVKEVYDQIVADLTQAETLLTGKTRYNTSHVNDKVVKGIRARVALQMEDYATAATKANEARQGFSLMSSANYGAGFGIVNSEWMWGLDVQNDQSTIFASFFSHLDPTIFAYAQLGTQKKITKDLYDQIPATDVRKSLFRTPGTGTTLIPDYSSTKFRLPVTGSWEGDYVLMRASEMYLIEAEALARTNNEANAKTLLETLVKARNSAYIMNPMLTGASLVNEILLQRRIELWGEGFSLLDIKRLKQGLNRPTGTGNHTSAMAVVFTKPVEDPSFLYKIPEREINANDAIEPTDQNP